jgi:hypothetical protein
MHETRQNSYIEHMSDATFNRALLVIVVLFLILTLPLVYVHFILDMFSPHVEYIADEQDSFAALPEKIIPTPQTALAEDEEEPSEPSREPEVIAGPLASYVRIINSCGVHFEGTCVRMRSGPGTEFPVMGALRNDIVLKVGTSTQNEDGIWYPILFEEWIWYPERIRGEYFVSGEYVELIRDKGELTVWDHGTRSTDKKIYVDRTEQKLAAYEHGELFMSVPISTGLELTPTPRGTFKVFKKTPTRYMQGPSKLDPRGDYYDLPGVPWNLYFTEDGAVIHGAYWHSSFGSPYSHGCVNLSPDNARKLYSWADLGTEVIVEN